MNIQSFYQGKIFNAYEYMGAHLSDEGTFFRTFAPNASKVSVIGDFNGWKEIQMNRISDGNFYEAAVPEALEGMRYKYRIYDKTDSFIDHCDPYGFSMELRPGTCSVIRRTDAYHFNDDAWMSTRTDCKDKPLNIYEIHAGSWKRDSSDPDKWLNYTQLADLLIPYVRESGYNFIEIMPLNEHPCDESWGYQSTGFFSPTSRYGTPAQLMEFVDKCHQNGIGVILDFIPVHFAVDGYGLTKYDGTCLYEYPSDDVGYNEWGSRNFIHSRGEVRSFLQSAADYWLTVYHFDGLRMDAVRNMIYWNGDEKRGENKCAINFLKTMNTGLKARHPSAILMAEDSSAYLGVTSPVSDGGLGFDYKWDLGWMNDTLDFFRSSPIFRSAIYHKLTFSMLYFHKERYIMPLSHDEVVHGKASITQKMNGQYNDKFPQARALYMYMIAHPGKKLNFMGNEFAQLREWNEKRQQDWDMLKYPIHDSFYRYIRDLNRIYLRYEALHLDYEPDNFIWADCNSTERCIYAFRRKSKTGDILTVLNLSDWYQPDYSLKTGSISEINLLLDSDSELYSGKTSEGKTLFTYTNGFLKMDIPPYSGFMFLLSE